jgi:hypothetical protein
MRIALRVVDGPKPHIGEVAERRPTVSKHFNDWDRRNPQAPVTERRLKPMGPRTAADPEGRSNVAPRRLEIGHFFWTRCERSATLEPM